MHAIEITQYGGPDEMRWVERSTPEPGPRQIRVRLEAAGVNFIDVYHRTGQYRVPLPYVMGEEGAGIVEAAGPGVADPPVGARVVWTGIAGSYATHVIVPVERAVLVPPAIEARTAAAVLLQGLTAHYLSHSTYALKPGEISSPLVSPFGIHVIAVLEEKPGGKTWREAEAELRPAVTRYLFRWIADQERATAKIEYLP